MLNIPPLIQKKTSTTMFQKDQLAKSQGFFKKRLTRDDINSMSKQELTQQDNLQPYRLPQMQCIDKKMKHTGSNNNNKDVVYKCQSSNLSLIGQQTLQQIESKLAVQQRNIQRPLQLSRHLSNQETLQPLNYHIEKNGYSKQLKLQSNNTLPFIQTGSISKQSTSESINVLTGHLRTLEEAIFHDVLGPAYFCENNRPNHKQLSSFFESPSGKNNICKPQDQIYKPDFLEGHQVNEELRAKMIDWMIQVFRVIDKSTHTTLFLAVSILDKYLKYKNLEGVHILRKQYHALGLTAIFIASKFEDVVPITMQQILRDAGHERFEREYILKTERDMLRTLQYQITTQDIYQDSLMILKTCEQDYAPGNLDTSDLKTAEKFLSFLSQMSLYFMKLILLPDRDLAIALNYVSLKFALKKLQTKFKAYYQFKDGKDNKYKESYLRLKRFCKFFKHQYLTKKLKTLTQIIIEEYLGLSLNNALIKNLERSFPEFLNDTAFHLFVSSQKLKI